MPGGGIEEGESVEQTAVREAKEETGIDAEAVRVLGRLEEPESHFVQLRPTTAPLPDSWTHHRDDGHVVECRWLRVRADTEVWGERGAFLHALIRKRVAAYVTRDANGGTELLVFDIEGQPELGTQVPAGRVDAHEDLEAALAREVDEEAGIAVEVVSQLADPVEHADAHGPGWHETFAFHAVAETGGPAAWKHVVTGSGADIGLVHACRWVPIDECPPLWGKPDPLVEKLRRSITEA